MTDDVVSIFDYDEEEGTIPDKFNLTALISEANRILSSKKCLLTKLEEGGYHKVYDVQTSDGEDMGVVARVACPAFPKDKMESEVATLKYLAEKTSVPVPTVIFWNSDASNEVGAEYMFITKVPGVSATSVWSDMSIDKKKNLVRQVAGNLMKLWALRFDAIGSLYLDKDRDDFIVGPIVENHFLTKCDGVPRVKEPIDLSDFRGPFTSISSYLQSGLRSELRLCAERLEDLIVEADGSPERVEFGRKGMEKALGLCGIYPGDKPLTNDTKEPITLKLGDLRLANIMINPDTGDVNAFIDLEFAITAPGWICADIPIWLRDDVTYAKDAFARSYDQVHRKGKGGCTIESAIDLQREEAVLLKEFLDTMRSLDTDGTWYRAFNAGKQYRVLSDNLELFIGAWGGYAMGKWVESVQRWLKEHPGVTVPSDVECLYPDMEERWPWLL